MFPVLFEIPVFESWIGALVVALVGMLFAFLAWRSKEDQGSWWLAAACVAGAGFILLHWGAHAPLGPLPIRLFGILVVLGFLAGTQVMAWRNRKLGVMTGEESFDLGFAMLLAGLLGARALWVLQNFDSFAGKPLEMVKIWDGGLVWYGGALGGIFYGWYWLSRRGKDLWAVTDSIGLAVPLGHAIGRIGCFCAGCDYGSVVEGGRESVPWAMNFPNRAKNPYTLVPPEFTYDAEKDREIYIHPAQLYESAALLLVFLILLAVDRKKGFKGRLAGLYLILYAISRSTVEHWRGDADRGLYFGGTVSFSQIVSALVLVAGILFYRHFRARAKAAGTA